MYSIHMFINKDKVTDTMSSHQWVPLYLLVLAVLFYLPRMFWLMIEGGLMKFFGQGTTSRWATSRKEI